MCHTADVSATQAEHRAGSFSNPTPAMPQARKTRAKCKGLLVRQVGSADGESGTKYRYVHCMCSGRISGYKHAMDALGGRAGVKTRPLPTPRCVTLLTDASSSSFHIPARTALPVKLMSDPEHDEVCG